LKGVLEVGATSKNLFGTALDVRVLKRCELESEKRAPALDNSSWGEPIYCEPFNVYHPCSFKGDCFSEQEILIRVVC
jgi:hypothetical protein